MVVLTTLYAGLLLAVWNEAQDDGIGESGVFVASLATGVFVILQLLLGISVRSTRRSSRRDELVRLGIERLDSVGTELRPIERRALRLALAPRLLKVSDEPIDDLNEPNWPNTVEILATLYSCEPSDGSSTTPNRPG